MADHLAKDLGAALIAEMAAVDHIGHALGQQVWEPLRARLAYEFAPLETARQGIIRSRHGSGLRGNG
ncbi:MAG: hypothetical protein IPJ56_18795 [Gemmatimonadetes bacterium]|nr:hypothetical protein [Gemmatimonadota bacterium]